MNRVYFPIIRRAMHGLSDHGLPDEEMQRLYREASAMANVRNGYSNNSTMGIQAANCYTPHASFSAGIGSAAWIGQANNTANFSNFGASIQQQPQPAKFKPRNVCYAGSCYDSRSRKAAL